MNESLIRLLMAPDLAGMTLTPSQVEEMHDGRLRIEAFRRLQALASPSPAQLRRSAELAESVDGLAVAKQCWQRAAEAGDEDAQEYYALLLEEESGS